MYREYKCIFEREKYVLVLRVEGYRNALAQFRMGVSPINVHRYRFSSIMEKKLCPICPDTPESEMHFLFACPLYNGLRSKFNIGMIGNDPEKDLRCVLSDNSLHVVLNLAKVIVQAFKAR